MEFSMIIQAYKSIFSYSNTLYEKAVEICDRWDTKFLFIRIHRNIEEKIYRTHELFRNENSQEQSCKLDGDQKQQFEL